MSLKMFDRLPYGSSIKDRLEAYSMPVTETGCQLWLASVDGHGYGNLGVTPEPGHHKTFRTHRLSYEEYVGPIPEGLCVLHRCDTPTCINPKHLFLGTHQDNVADKMRKGRAPHGEGSYLSRLTDKDVVEIAGFLQGGDHSQEEIAAKYGVTPTHISNINAGRVWSRVTGASRDNRIASTPITFTEGEFAEED